MKTIRAVGWVWVFSVCLFVAVNAFSKPRPSLPPLPEMALNLWRFDHTNWWTHPRTAPSEMQGVSLLESWSGYAVYIGAESVLRFPAVNAENRINLCLDEGSVRFWLATDWTSGTGPGVWMPLVESGAWSADASIGWWALYVNPTGTEILFSSQGNGVSRHYLSAAIAWNAGEWHQIALTFSEAASTALYIDGELAAQGPAICCLPSVESYAASGFTVGGGVFDELTTFSYPLSADEVKFNYNLTARQAAKGPITPEEEAAWQLWITQKQLGADDASLSPDGAAMTMSGPPMPGPGGGGGGTNPPPQGLSGPGLKLRITNLTNGTARLEPLEREPGASYDLLYTLSLNPTISWQWLQEIPPATNFVIVSATNPPTRFFTLKKVPDADGDGVRDFWEFGGSPPGPIDDDNDNDGIPDTIEVASGSSPDDADSLPPPTLYVDRNAPASGDGSLDLPFTAIGTALSQATNYSVILVKPGTYAGASNRNLSFGGKKLVLISEKGWEETLINCGDAANRAFTFTSTDENYAARVSGFSIFNAGTNGAVRFTGGSAPTFVNCAFTRNASGAVHATNANPAFINCRFLTNWSTANGVGIFASGSSTVKVSHCTFNENTHTNLTSSIAQIWAQNSARVIVVNSIVWRAPALPPQIAATNTATNIVSYSLVRGGYPGTGNFTANPQFESWARLLPTSPCIDQGVPDGIPGFRLFSRFDMDGETRLDHRGFTNTYSTFDIGADEFVYRIQFPTVLGTNWVLSGSSYVAQTNFFSEVDEASGVAFLGTNAAGPIISVVDDEDRDKFRIYQLNSDATAVAASIPIAITNASYTGGQQEIGDMEGLTFDGSGNLYVITSQSKRNRYRDVDSSPPIVDALVDPPSNDYDRRRAVVARITLDSTKTNATSRQFFEPEHVSAPFNTAYEPANGLVAHVRQQLLANPILQATNPGQAVLIAWNSVNKFGTPVNGIPYFVPGTDLPYRNGGNNFIAGKTVGHFSGTSGTLTNPVSASLPVIYYKIWAVGAQFRYQEGPTVTVINDARPVLQINEFDAAGGTEAVELYNPSLVPLNISGFGLSDDLANLHRYTFPPGTVIPGRSVLTISNSVWGTWSFPDNPPFDPVLVSWTNQPAPTVLDRWTMKDPDAGSVDFTQGRVWDGGPRGFINIDTPFESCSYQEIPGTPYPPNLRTLNHPQPRKHFDAVANHINRTNVYLSWGNIGTNPAVASYSPKQHDFHALNIEDVAYRSGSEMVIGLRAPLANRTNGNAYYFTATNLATFLPGGGWTGPAQGISEARQMALGGMGIRSIKWCPTGLTNAQGQTVPRYLVLAGNANGGPILREAARQKFSLHAWDGSSSGGLATPQLLIADLNGYAVRPEGVDLINVNGEWRVLFVEDRFVTPGYATRNAVHWPISILGAVQ